MAAVDDLPRGLDEQPEGAHDVRPRRVQPGQDRPARRHQVSGLQLEIFAQIGLAIF